ncbi:hypothetical protein J6590_023657 [Homalodisca vitripennis]|nr:hypothetical protein J6590_023657 [Homalodisca vitripennis]
MVNEWESVQVLSIVEDTQTELSCPSWRTLRQSCPVHRGGHYDRVVLSIAEDTTTELSSNRTVIITVAISSLIVIVNCVYYRGGHSDRVVLSIVEDTQAELSSNRTVIITVAISPLIVIVHCVYYRSAVNHWEAAA